MFVVISDTSETQSQLHSSFSLDAPFWLLEMCASLDRFVLECHQALNSVTSEPLGT